MVFPEDDFLFQKAESYLAVSPGIHGKNLEVIPRCDSMVLEYFPTQLGHQNGVKVGKYFSTTEHMGWVNHGL